MKDKWYSEKLTAETTKELTKLYAKISKPQYGWDSELGVCMRFELVYETGMSTGYFLSPSDSTELLTLTKKATVQDLDGLVVEAYKKGKILQAISVNHNLL